MKKFIHLLVWFAIVPTLLCAQNETKYLAGAVPEVDGKVVFSREFDLPGVKQDDIFDRMLLWAGNRMKEAESGQVVFQDKAKGQIVAIAKEYLVFSSSALSLDRSLMEYQLTIFCTPGKCVVEMEKIRYNYQDNERYLAEEWINDKNALNKTQTKIVRSIRKFRVNTIDFADALFDNAREALGIAKVEPLAKVEEPEVLYTPLVKSEVTPVVTPIATVPNAYTTEQVAPAEFAGYTRISPNQIPGNIIKMLSDDWMLVTAGSPQAFNMMTASWGGLGTLYGKPVAFCFINPARHTYQVMEKDDTYTLTFYTEAYRDALKYCGTHSGKNEDKVKESGLTPVTTPGGAQAFSQAWLIIECRKLISQSLNTGAITDDAIRNKWSKGEPHKMYIGEIVNVWVK